MQFIDYNFVSDDVAKNIMESYGYEVPDKDEVVSEDVAAPELPDYVCVVNETTYALCEGVEEVDGQLFIPVMEVKAELHEALAENDTTLLESVEMDDTSYTFGDIFEDEKTGEMFIAINEQLSPEEYKKQSAAYQAEVEAGTKPRTGNHRPGYDKYRAERDGVQGSGDKAQTGGGTSFTRDLTNKDKGSMNPKT